MKKKFDEETMLKIRVLLRDFVGNAPSGEGIEDRYGGYHETARLVDVYAEAAALWQMIENAGYLDNDAILIIKSILNKQKFS